MLRGISATASTRSSRAVSSEGAASASTMTQYWTPPRPRCSCRTRRGMTLRRVRVGADGDGFGVVVGAGSLRSESAVHRPWRRARPAPRCQLDDRRPRGMVTMWRIAEPRLSLQAVAAGTVDDGALVGLHLDVRRRPIARAQQWWSKLTAGDECGSCTPSRGEAVAHTDLVAAADQRGSGRRHEPRAHPYAHGPRCVVPWGAGPRDPDALREPRIRSATHPPHEVRSESRGT